MGRDKDWHQAVFREKAFNAVGTTRFDLLKQSLEFCQAVLQIYSREHTPTLWAGTRDRMAIFLRDQALLAKDGTRIALLKQAVEAHQAALQVYTQEFFPIYWAFGKNELGGDIVRFGRS